MRKQSQPPAFESISDARLRGMVEAWVLRKYLHVDDVRRFVETGPIADVLNWDLYFIPWSFEFHDNNF
jgi:hypothetical protein